MTDTTELDPLMADLMGFMLGVGGDTNEIREVIARHVAPLLEKARRKGVSQSIVVIQQARDDMLDKLAVLALEEDAP